MKPPEKGFNESCYWGEPQMLAHAETEGIVKRGQDSTLHTMIRINRKFGDRISPVLQESA